MSDASAPAASHGGHPDDPPSPPAPQVGSCWEAPAPRWASALAAALTLAAALAPLALLQAGRRGLLPAAPALPGPWATAWPGTWVGLALAPAAVALGFLAWARRRWGRARVEGDLLVVRGALSVGARRFALAELEPSASSPHGLVLRVAGEGLLERWLSPVFVPVVGAAERGELAAQLGPAPQEGDVVLRPARCGWAGVRAAVGGLLVVLGGALLPQAWGPWLGLLGVVAAALLLLGLETWWQPPAQRVRLGAAGLLLDQVLLAWGDLRRLVLLPEGRLAVEGPRRRWVLEPEPPHDEPQAARAVAERARALLAAAGRGDRWREGAPYWALPPARRQQARRRFALACAPGLALLALSRADPPLYAELRLLDQQGYQVQLLSRRGSDAPRLLVIRDLRASTGVPIGFARVVLPHGWSEARGEPGGVWLDLSEERGWLGGLSPGPVGRDARVVFHDERGLSSSSAPLPDRVGARLRELRASGVFLCDSVAGLLEPELPDAAVDPLLREWLEGRRGRGVFQVVDVAGRRLVWGAAHGRTAFVAHLPGTRAAHTEGLPLAWTCAGAGPSVGLRSGSTWLSPGGEVRRSESAPDPAALLAVTRAVRAGARLADLWEGGIPPRIVSPIPGK